MRTSIPVSVTLVFVPLGLFSLFAVFHLYQSSSTASLISTVELTTFSPVVTTTATPVTSPTPVISPERTTDMPLRVTTLASTLALAITASYSTSPPALDRHTVRDSENSGFSPYVNPRFWWRGPTETPNMPVIATTSTTRRPQRLTTTSVCPSTTQVPPSTTTSVYISRPPSTTTSVYISRPPTTSTEPPRRRLSTQFPSTSSAVMPPTSIHPTIQNSVDTTHQNPPVAKRSPTLKPPVTTQQPVSSSSETVVTTEQPTSSTSNPAVQSTTTFAPIRSQGPVVTTEITVTTVRPKNIPIDTGGYRCELLEHLRLCVLTKRRRCLLVQLHMGVPRQVMASEFDATNIFASQSDVIRIRQRCNGYTVHTT